jgi:hypothetical protein
MAVDADILDAVKARTNSLPGSLRVGLPNVSFDPGDDDIWLHIDLFPNEPENLSWDSDKQLYLGFVQFRVYTKLYRGIFKITDEAENIIAHFAKGTELGPVMVSRRPWLSPKIIEDDKCFIPVTVPYRGIA